mmetsp:Transcript_19223/g.26883  ORF Transcript_19223/g.26883 Transcript_19223/m.26883 type:complete len:138 (+) Transcript_19223:814-1227(+)
MMLEFKERSDRCSPLEILRTRPTREMDAAALQESTKNEETKVAKSGNAEMKTQKMEPERPETEGASKQMKSFNVPSAVAEKVLKHVEHHNENKKDQSRFTKSKSTCIRDHVRCEWDVRFTSKFSADGRALLHLLSAA